MGNLCKTPPSDLSFEPLFLLCANPFSFGLASGEFCFLLVGYFVCIFACEGRRCFFGTKVWRTFCQVGGTDADVFSVAATGAVDGFFAFGEKTVRFDGVCGRPMDVGVVDLLYIVIDFAAVCRVAVCALTRI